MKLPIKIIEFITYLTGRNHDSIVDMFNSYCGQFRSTSQNNALHLYFKMISDKLNELGWTYTEICFFTGKPIEYIWTPELVKEKIWRPLQKTLFNTESTTQLTTEQINIIVETLNKHFAENGIEIQFPCWQTFMNEIDKKNGKEI